MLSIDPRPDTPWPRGMDIRIDTQPWALLDLLWVWGLESLPPASPACPAMLRRLVGPTWEDAFGRSALDHPSHPGSLHADAAAYRRALASFAS